MARYKKLRGVLYENELTQKDLARITKKSESYIAVRMSGRYPFTFTDAYTILDSFDIPHDQMSLYFPPDKEIHISCIFSWDKAYAEDLAYQWEARTDKPVKLGGPAFGSSAENFVPGMYIKPNIIFTTRGCNNNCPWCIVPKVEGRFRELPVIAGNVIQDNNFLQASRAHKDKVFDMLRTQKQICFKGGLEPGLIDNHFVDALQSLYYMRGTKKVSRVSELWLACDTEKATQLAQGQFTISENVAWMLKSC